MRFSLIASLLAFASPMLSVATPLVTTSVDVTGLCSVGGALSVVNALTAAITPLEKSINSTIAGLGSAPTAAQLAAAENTVNILLGQISAAINNATAFIALEVNGIIPQTGSGNLANLVAAIINLVEALLATINAALKIVNLQAILAAVYAVLGALSGFIISLEAVVTGLTAQLGPLLASVITLLSGVLTAVKGLLGALLF